MADLNAELTAFLESYRRAFEDLDPEAVSRHLAFPWHLCGDSGATVELQVVGDAAAARPILERLLGMYRQIGVASARYEVVGGWETSANLAQILVHWRLANAEGESLYDFRAGYTLVKTESGWRVGAITHNELAQLRRFSGRR